MVSLVVPWTPHAKQRPRVYGKVATTPAATKKAEKAIAEAFIDAAPDLQMFDGPVAVELVLHGDRFEIEIYEVPPYEIRRLKGDIDNYMKTILDALNGVAWEDDKQIVYLAGRKS